jgi:hypothetical protein
MRQHSIRCSSCWPARTESSDHRTHGLKPRCMAA